MTKTFSRTMALALWAVAGCGDEFVEPVPAPDAGLQEDGSFRSSTTLLPECERRRLRLIIASPGALKIGQATSVEAQLQQTEAPTGTPNVSWWLQRDGVSSPQGALKLSTTCQPTMDACVRFTCTGLPGASEAGQGLWVVAKYEDALCYDVARVIVECGDRPVRDGGTGPAVDGGLPGALDAGSIPARDAGADVASGAGTFE